MPGNKPTMTLITQTVLAEAAITVNGMGMAERVRLADEVFAHQPNRLPPSWSCSAWEPVSRRWTCRYTSCS